MKQELTALEALREILSTRGGGTQEDLRDALEKQGFDVNQSTISRHLRRLRAVKIFEPSGEATYKLPDSEEVLPHVEDSLSDLVHKIVHNDTLIVIHTSPGSASLIARKLDHFEDDTILGTIAGDDTIFVAITSGLSLKSTAVKLRRFFGKA